MDRSIALVSGLVVLCVLIVSLRLLLKAESRRDLKPCLIFKSLCSLMFWLFGWIALGYAQTGMTPMASYMLLGFTLSVLGDVFLVYTKDKSFMLGLFSFFLAHASFSVSFILRYGFNYEALICFLSIACMTFIVLNFPGRLHLGRMRVWANIYLAILSFMLSNAIYGLFSVTTGQFSALLTALGAGLFFISDFTLAYEKFSNKKINLAKPVLITYYSAQILFGLGMAAFLIN